MIIHPQPAVPVAAGNLSETIMTADAAPTPSSTITLLTYDPEAGMAYLYCAPPGSRQATTTRMNTEQHYGAAIDYAEDGALLGAEFPAVSAQSALCRALVLAQTLGHPR